MLERGVRGIFDFSGAEFAVPPLLSPRCFDRYVAEFNSRIYRLVHQYAEHVRRLTEATVRAGAPGGGFILDVCAALYRRPLPKPCSDNLKVMIDTAAA
jgi:hypothetical protein